RSTRPKGADLVPLRAAMAPDFGRDPQAREAGVAYDFSPVRGGRNWATIPESMRSGRNSVRHLTLVSVTLAVALALAHSPALAQDYPTRPVTVIVPFPAGGPSDTIARVTAQSMSKLLGQQLIVENVAGAGGTLGTGRAARSAADGYTLLLHH